MAPVAELVDELRSEVRSVASSTLSTGYLFSLRTVLVFMDKAFPGHSILSSSAFIRLIIDCLHDPLHTQLNRHCSSETYATF